MFPEAYFDNEFIKIIYKKTTDMCSPKHILITNLTIEAKHILRLVNVSYRYIWRIFKMRHV